MQDFIDLFTASPLLAGGLVFFLGLCLGSFLNVVIYRVPVMMDRDWLRNMHDLLSNPSLAARKTQAALGSEERFREFMVAVGPETTRFSLMTPASHCPRCNHKIRSWENIPVVSWLFLRGKCSACSLGISIRYPLVELGTALLSLLVFAMFGPTGKMVTALALTWTLIALTMIDFDTQYLPDDITLPLLWAGLLINTQGVWVSLDKAVIGAALGYLSLWSVTGLFKLATGKEGMGQGDFKLLAALGAWLGPVQLPLVILMSSVVGSVIGGVYYLIRKESAPFAFGPYLAISGFIAMLGGPEIVGWYLGTLHLHH